MLTAAVASDEYIQYRHFAGMVERVLGLILYPFVYNVVPASQHALHVDQKALE